VDQRVAAGAHALGRWETLLAGAALVGCLVAIAADGAWRWLAVPFLGALFFLAMRRTSRVEQALARSEEGFRQLVDLPVQATFITDARGNLLQISRRWEEWTGLDLARSAQRNWVEIMHLDERKNSVDRWFESVATGQPYDQTFRLRMADGEHRWFRARAFPQRDADGAVTRWVGAVEKIHKKRVAEEQLRHTAGVLEMIGRSTASMIYAKDREGRMLYCNRALEELTGLGVADMLGKTDAEWNPNLPEAEVLQATDRLVLASGATQDLEEAFTGHDGKTRIYQTLKSPLRDQSGQIIGVVGVSTDISAAREAEQREKLLSRELDHRAKNLLAVVQSVVSLTRADTLPEFKAAIEGRIQALGRAHSMLAASRWEGAELERVLAEELAPYCGNVQDAVTLTGPSLLLKPAAAQSLALVIHELATNAAKYGALSLATGELEVQWDVSDGAMLDLSWEERGGPPVKPRTQGSRRGFGSRLIQSSIERQLGGTLQLRWAASGLKAWMRIPLDRAVTVTSERVAEPGSSDPVTLPR
jgi:PAS domain S-box-containing protein